MRLARLLLLVLLAPPALAASAPAPPASAVDARAAAPTVVPAFALPAPSGEETCWVLRCFEDGTCIWVDVC